MPPTLSLENIRGDLRFYNQLVRGTFQHVDELQDERLVDETLRDLIFYPADGHGYFLREDGGIDWAITREENNLVLVHLDDEVNSSYEQLIRNNNFLPDNAEALAAKNAESTDVFDMNKLRLFGKDGVYRFLEIRTSDGYILTGKNSSGENKYESCDNEEQRVLTRLGYTSDVLRMLSDNKIKATAIYVLNPDYVKKKINENSDHSSLWRASWLNDFDNNSNFFANNRLIFNHDRLRGVRQPSAASVNIEPQASSVIVEVPFGNYVTIPSSDSELSSCERNQRLAARSNAQREADTQTYQPPKLEAGRFSDLEFYTLEEVKTELASSGNSPINIEDFFDEPPKPRSEQKKPVYNRFSGLDLDE